jgi:hypothetical protein
MTNPFEQLEARLSNIENLLLDIKHKSNNPEKIEENKMLYSLKELANFLGCSIVTAFKLKNSKKIRYQQFGRKLIFNTSEVNEDLRKIGGIKHRKINV